MTPSSNLVRFSVALSAALTMVGASAAGARSGSMADAQARYQQDRATCLGGQSNQDRATCLKEAGAALSEARRGNLHGTQGQKERNTLERCNALAGAERSDCVARMHGEGTTEGSVAGGGILREKVTIEPAAPAALPGTTPSK